MSVNFPNADFTPQLAGYTGQGAFRFWCQKVLPIVYDDSLSYYELLNKVVNYLNNVISDVATVEGNIGEIAESYVNLQNYVNEHMQEISGVVNEFTDFITHYFDNLDVQEEINTKLNNMAIDGTLSNLVRPIVANTAPSIITDWLDSHVGPTQPIVDSSLSISGAAADAKVTGEGIESALTGVDDTNSLDGIVHLKVPSYNGTANIRFDLKTYIPRGTPISIHVDNITSNDTDANVCGILVSDATAVQSVLLLVERGKPSTITRTFYFDAYAIRVYASDNYNHSLDDSFEFSGLVVRSYDKLYLGSKSAKGFLRGQNGWNSVVYSPMFEMTNKIRRANTLFSNFSFQSMIYVESLNKYFVAGSILSLDGQSVFASFDSLYDLANPIQVLYANMGHCNDMTYNPDTGLIYVIHGGNNRPEGNVTRNGISIIDPNTFSVIGELVIGRYTEMQSIDYYEGYFYIRSDNVIAKFELVDNNLVFIQNVVAVDYDAIKNAVSPQTTWNKYFSYNMIVIKNGIIYYLLAYYADPDYRYQPRYSIICKYDLITGSPIGYTAFMCDINNEAEALIFDGERACVICMMPHFITFYELKYKADYYNATTKNVSRGANIDNILVEGHYCLTFADDAAYVGLPDDIDTTKARGIALDVSLIRHSDIMQKMTVVYNDGAWAEYLRVIRNDGELNSGWVKH